ncbi:uncharacterized protein [Onthophagus taurus]|uniref:uncharacterized protein n=1 Tax=Onthophagus taurus TaxID=166361 RepID=UPI0039BE68E3
MVRSCSVSGCKTQFTKGTKFHKFPKDPTLRNQWIEVIGRKGFIPSESDIICSIHFTNEDYTINSFGNKVLKKNVLPSMFDVSITEDTEPNVETESLTIETITACNSNDEGTITAYNSNDEDTISLCNSNEETVSAFDSNDEGTVSSCELDELTVQGKSTVVIYENGINLEENNLKGGEKIEIVNVSGENQAIIEVDKIFHKNENVDTTSVKRKRPYRQYRYIGDLKNVDFTSPDEARRCLELALGCVDNQKLKIKRLRQQVKNTNKFILQAEFEMQRMLEKKVMEI